MVNKKKSIITQISFILRKTTFSSWTGHQDETAEIKETNGFKRKNNLRTDEPRRLE